ncbi:hypothetical protein BNJ_00288 [Kaumoebavirus]|uniref:hypothetical protein n=1 Tax=Kaumoebavirus TaxID=1859492 RepID=UPI0009C23D4A|nr:hypothetical protein BNJ_00288 [Kaumoebavirus]ARA72111.1 hypothetical protein BNJ_00288 [Kaumoebavirus]
MDITTIEFLSRVLPAEIVMMIDNILLETYKRKNAAKCAEMILENVEAEHWERRKPISVISVGGRPKLKYTICDCGEPISARISSNRTFSQTHVLCNRWAPLHNDSPRFKTYGRLIRYEV